MSRARVGVGQSNSREAFVVSPPDFPLVEQTKRCGAFAEALALGDGAAVDEDQGRVVVEDQIVDNGLPTTETVGRDFFGLCRN